MPRGPRLDHPGALHHVIARGIERSTIFRDDSDREDFLSRVERLVLDGSLSVYAWALMPNHVHLLVRTGSRSIGSSMRSLLGGYATVHNRRHERVGHLFQNRYKSILCDEEAYFQTLVQYIHLNPIEGGLVASLADLDDHRWTGHSALMSQHPRRWQDVGFVLDAFGTTRAEAIKLYRSRLADRLVSDEPLNLDGGGVRRSLDAFEAIETLPRGRECFRSDERVLGRSSFTEAILKELGTLRCPRGTETLDFERLAAAVANELGLPVPGMTANGRSRAQTRARDALAFLWIHGLGRSGRSLADRIGVTASAVYLAARRGRREQDRWLELLRMLSERARSS